MDAFLLSTETVAGYQVKPWNLTTQKAIKYLEDKELSDADQAAAMVYIQTQPARAVREAMAAGTLLENIQDFIGEIPLAQVVEVRKWCDRQVKLIEQSQIQIIPRGEPDPKEPPNL